MTLTVLNVLIARAAPSPGVHLEVSNLNSLGSYCFSARNSWNFVWPASSILDMVTDVPGHGQTKSLPVSLPEMYGGAISGRVQDLHPEG